MEKVKLSTRELQQWVVHSDFIYMGNVEDERTSFKDIRLST